MFRIILVGIVLASLTRCGGPAPVNEKAVCPQGCDIVIGLDGGSSRADAGVR
jgi:hypothetical protein